MLPLDIMPVSMEKGSDENCGQAAACQDASSGCAHSVCFWLDWRFLSSWLFDDLVSCALGSAGHSGTREQRARLSPAVPAMVWWTVPRQIPEAIPRCAWQSHSTLPKPPISKELYQATHCFYSGRLVLPAYMEKFLDRMPQLRQGLIKGVFQTKASSPWAGNKSQSIQVSLCLPNKRDLDTWYEAVFALPIAWPDITDIDPHYLKKTSAYQLLSIRMQMGVSHMWGGISPQWHLLKYHLWNLGPGYHAGRLEELLILNRPCRPGEDVKDSVLPQSHWQAWKKWECQERDWIKGYQGGGYLVRWWGRSSSTHPGGHQ